MAPSLLSTIQLFCCRNSHGLYLETLLRESKNVDKEIIKQLIYVGVKF